MEEEKKKGEGEATEETSSEETEAKAEDAQTEETEGSEAETAEETEESEEDIDYDEVAEKAKGEKKPLTELEKARFKRSQIDQRIKELEGEGKKTDSEELKSDLRRELQEERAQELVASVSQNPKEQQAILAAWKAGWVRREGTVLEQLLDVQAVINRKRQKKVEELRNQRGEATPNATGSGSKLPSQSKEPTLAPELRNIMKDAKWDAKKGVWKLPNGTEISPKQLGA